MKLFAKFKTSSGKTQTWSLDNPNMTKSPTEIKGLLGRIGGLKLFKKNEDYLFHQVEEAFYRETIDTEIFKGE